MTSIACKQKMLLVKDLPLTNISYSFSIYIPFSFNVLADVERVEMRLRLLLRGSFLVIPN